MEIKEGNKYLNTGGVATLGCVIKVISINYNTVDYKIVKEVNNNIRSDYSIGDTCHCLKKKFEDYFQPITNKIRKLR